MPHASLTKSRVASSKRAAGSRWRYGVLLSARSLKSRQPMSCLISGMKLSWKALKCSHMYASAAGAPALKLDKNTWETKRQRVI